MSPKKIPKTEIGFDQKKHVFHYESNAYQNTPFPELTLSLHYDFAVLPRREGASLLFSPIDSFHDPIMQYVLGGSLHKNNTIFLPLGLYHASVN